MLTCSCFFPFETYKMFVLFGFLMSIFTTIGNYVVRDLYLIKKYPCQLTFEATFFQSVLKLTWAELDKMTSLFWCHLHKRS